MIHAAQGIESFWVVLDLTHGQVLWRGGWVGGWVDRKVEENEAVGMSYCE